MAKVVGLLNGANNQNTDFHFSTPVSTILTQGVIEGLGLTQPGGAGTYIKVNMGKALIKVTRTSIIPNEVFLCVFNNTAVETITCGNSKKIYIEISSARINNPALNIERAGTGIGNIVIADDYPSANYLPLGETNSSGMLSITTRQEAKLKGDKLDSNINITNTKGNNWKLFYTNGSGQTQELSFGTAGQVLGFTGVNSAPAPISPTVDILGLSETTTPTTSWLGIFYNGTNNVKTTLANLVKGLGYATKTLQGVIKLATDSEANGGTNDSTAVTPKQSKIKTAFAFQTLSFSSGGTIGNTVTINHNMGVIPRLITIKSKTSNTVEPNYHTGVATYDGTTITQNTTSFRSGIISGIASYDTNDSSLDPAYRYISAITNTSITLTRGNTDDDGNNVLYLFTFIG